MDGRFRLTKVRPCRYTLTAFGADQFEEFRKEGVEVGAGRETDLGELKWDGEAGCYFAIDPKQDMFFVLLEQTPSERQKIQPMVKKLIYEAMEN